MRPPGAEVRYPAVRSKEPEARGYRYPSAIRITAPVESNFAVYTVARSALDALPRVTRWRDANASIVRTVRGSP